MVERRAVAGDEIDQPFPLRARFVGRFLPFFLLLLVVVSVAGGIGAASIMESIYLDVAERRAAVIDKAVSAELPDTWRTLSGTGEPAAVLASPEGVELTKYLVAESDELGLSHLKIYRTDGTTIFSLDPAQIGEIESNASFAETLHGDKAAARKALPDGRAVYELYIPYVSPTAGATLIFELYEPVGQLDSALLNAGLPAVVMLAALLGILAFGLFRLVARAQRDIDRRTALLIDFRSRLERFVSQGAVRAARESVGARNLASRRIDGTIFFSDIRSFTSFSEQREPADVVAFLNRVVAAQIDCIERHGGDVDKMIGDAVLALFQGEGRERRALAAAVEAQQALARLALPREVGIGIFSGPTVVGPVGPPNRMDFTVIGDSVNAAARLCSAAGAREVVCDVATLEAAQADGFGAEESLTVKGRDAPIVVRRARF